MPLAPRIGGREGVAEHTAAVLRCPCPQGAGGLLRQGAQDALQNAAALGTGAFAAAVRPFAQEAIYGALKGFRVAHLQLCLQPQLVDGELVVQVQRGREPEAAFAIKHIADETDSIRKR